MLSLSFFIVFLQGTEFKDRETLTMHTHLQYSAYKTKNAPLFFLCLCLCPYLAPCPSPSPSPAPSLCLDPCPVHADCPFPSCVHGDVASLASGTVTVMKNETVCGVSSHADYSWSSPFFPPFSYYSVAPCHCQTHDLTLLKEIAFSRSACCPSVGWVQSLQLGACFCPS